MIDMPPLLVPGPHLASVRMLCCDVDGVLTDGGLYYDSNGRALLRFHVLDGQGLKRVQERGVKVCFISQSEGGPIKQRAKVLGIDHCLMGVDDKLAAIEPLLSSLGISLQETAHIADDLNDISLLKAVGVAVTVPGGVPEVKQIAQFVTRAEGGHGAVRALCDALLASIA
mgnify:CR=1 FL=1